MTELKTLNDMDLNYEDIWDMKRGTPEDILKAESIKWVKEWKSDERLSYPTATVFENAPLALIQLELETKIKLFMSFFNLTEEDLK